MKTLKTIKSITTHSKIDGVVPGVKGQRAFPTHSLRNTDPFIMLDHIGPQKLSKDYFMDGHAHPHRGFETITFMFEGVMEHIDSLGNSATLKSGSVQRMNAGKGIIHGGDMSVADSQIFHEIQLWVNLPSSQKLSEPNIHNVHDHQIPVIEKGKVKIRIVSGKQQNIIGPIKTVHPINAFHIISNEDRILSISDLPSTHNTYLYLMKGQISINDQILESYNTISFNKDGDQIEFEVKEGSELLILSGEPINEPVAMGGPFVMNTNEEIEQAYADYRDGKFGKVTV
ncbi:pirin family protein [Sediminitomix flava]|uniref:Pirin family protein n=1 Tax=Sediminitomix flava TaxID=379075 RepID=A0A315ZF90_SEDFL|nr:pirin family protein [Sediminitomix flava]PWJ44171.1 hypothetical protein BC781_101521 [Sediminitomix flava]